jgi:signal peptide peptidase SppA
MTSDDAVRPTSGTMPPPARGDASTTDLVARRVWRRSTTTREPLLVAASALDVEYEDPAVHREPSGEAGVIVVDIHGPLEHHEHPCFASFENVTRIVCAVLDRSDVQAVVMRIDSPGGVANGMSQASQAIRSHADRAGKPLYVYVDEQACSAAYGIACAADEIWGPPTAEVGSVGVILPVCDVTAANEAAGVRVDLITTGARKGDGDPNKPLTDDVRAALQTRVDAIGEDFFALVSARRGMSVDEVRGLEAGVFVGSAAVDAGLMDGVATFAEFLAIVKASVTERPEGAATGDQEMAKTSRLALVKAHQDAEAVLRAATTPDAIAAATLTLAEAARALEGATVKPAAGARYYKETTKIEERVEDMDSEEEAEDDDEPESERGEDDDDAPPSSKPEGAVEDAEDMDGEDMDSEEDMEDDGEKKDAEDEPKKDGKRMAKKAKKMADPEGEEEAEDDKREVPKKYPGASSGASAGARASVLGHVRALTGSKDRAVMLGKLDALAEKAARYDAIVQKRAQADQGKRTAQLIDEAIRAGKVGPKNAKLIDQLRAMEPKRLSAFLDSMPVLVRREAVAAAVAPDGGAMKVDTLSRQAREVIAAVARTTGKSIEQATAEYVDAYSRAAGR